jgi:hypothetical protein
MAFEIWMTSLGISFRHSSRNVLKLLGIKSPGYEAHLIMKHATATKNSEIVHRRDAEHAEISNIDTLNFVIFVSFVVKFLFLK